MTFPNIDINMILSDPLLLIGVFLLVFGPLLFLVSLIKIFRTKPKDDFVVPHYPVEEDVQSQSAGLIRNGRNQESHPSPVPMPEPEPVAVEPAPTPRFMKEGADRTTVMPPFVAELQAGLEIALTQVKQLNRKVIELERVVEHLQSGVDVQLDANELKEPPMDPADFTKKLLKVVEHVIVLEKEVAALRSKPTGAATPAKPQFELGSAPPVMGRPPILPL